MVQFVHQDTLNENVKGERPDFSAPIEPGVYTAQIIESDYVPLKGNNGGNRYVITHEIISGEHAGRRIWHSLNSDPARHHDEGKRKMMINIAGNHMQQMCVAVGLEGSLQDTEQLHGIPMLITIAEDKRQDDPSRAHKITHWKATKGAKSQTATKGGAGAGNHAASAPAHPWVRGES